MHKYGPQETNVGITGSASKASCLHILKYEESSLFSVHGCGDRIQNSIRTVLWCTTCVVCCPLSVVCCLCVVRCVVCVCCLCFVCGLFVYDHTCRTVRCVLYLGLWDPRSQIRSIDLGSDHTRGILKNFFN